MPYNWPLPLFLYAVIQYNLCTSDIEYVIEVMYYQFIFYFQSDKSHTKNLKYGTTINDKRVCWIRS